MPCAERTGIGVEKGCFPPTPRKGLQQVRGPVGQRSEVAGGLQASAFQLLSVVRQWLPRKA